MSNSLVLRLGLTSLVATTGIVVYSLNPTVNKPPPSDFPKPPPGYATAVAPVGSGSRSRLTLNSRSNRQIAYVDEKREDIIEALAPLTAEKGRVPEFHDTMPANGMHQDL